MSLRIVLLATIDPTVRAIASMSVACDLPHGIEVRHDLRDNDVTLVASDQEGVQYRDDRVLGHGCLSCAVREGLIPALQWIALQQRWDTVLVTLPATASPMQVAWTIEEAILDGSLGGQVLAHVVSVVDETSFMDDLLGTASVHDRGLALADSDERSLGEALSGILEASDTLVTLGEPNAPTQALLTHVLNPETTLWRGLAELPVDAVVAHESWVTDLPPRWAPDAMPVPLPADTDDVWTIDLVSEKPFHPGRLHEQVELLGSGRIHARGCFWLPSRPDSLCAWDAAGGQLSIGEVASWGTMPRLTHLRVTGTDPGERERIRRSFADVLLTDHEMRTALTRWRGRSDGLEPWLGDAHLGDVGSGPSTVLRGEQHPGISPGLFGDFHSAVVRTAQWYVP